MSLQDFPKLSPLSCIYCEAINERQVASFVLQLLEALREWLIYQRASTNTGAK